MFFYLYKKTNGKSRTTKELKDEWYLFKHHYIFLEPLLSYILLLFILVIGVILSVMGLIIVNPNKLSAMRIIIDILLCIIILLSVYLEIIIIKRNKMLRNQRDYMEMIYFILDKFCMFFLLNPFVISFRDWKKIKRVSKENYKKIRSSKAYAKCYETTFYIANILKNDKIKILWIIFDINNQKGGHAVLVKGNRIYDTNRIRTYNKARYLEHNNAKIYREFTSSEYLLKDEKDFKLLVNGGIQAKIVYDFLKSDWENFKFFCDSNGALRATCDET